MSDYVANNTAFLEKIQGINAITDNEIQLIDLILSIPDYRSVPPEQWHATLQRFKTVMELQKQSLAGTAVAFTELVEMAHKSLDSTPN